MKKSELALGNIVKRNKGEEEFVITSINEDVVVLNGRNEVKISTFLRSFKLIKAVENEGNFMNIKDYATCHNFHIINMEHEGINYKFENIRKSNHSHSCKYIIFDEKFALRKVSNNVYKLVDFCRLEKFSKQIDKVSYNFHDDLFEVEMLDKNDKSYVIQFIHNEYDIDGQLTLRVYEKSGRRYAISNPYGPAFVSFENNKVAETKFYLLGEEKSEFEIEVLKATID